MILIDNALDPVHNDSIIKFIEEGNDEMVLRHNILLVYKLASDYKPQFSPIYEDLVQEGILGLLHAITKYDTASGASFATYATLWIKQKMRLFLASQSQLRTPHVAATRISKVKKMFKESDKEPTVKEIAQALDISEYSAKKVILDSKNTYASLDDSGISEVLGFTEYEDISEIYNLIEDAISHLTEREQDILSKRFSLKGVKFQKLQSICIDYGISRERVRQIEAGALDKLKMRLYHLKEEARSCLRH